MPPFASQLSFLDPQLTSNGKPYAPLRVNEVIRQCYAISKHCNTSYLDVLEISPRERETLLSLIEDELKKKHEALEKISKSKKKGR